VIPPDPAKRGREEREDKGKEGMRREGRKGNCAVVNFP